MTTKSPRLRAQAPTPVPRSVAAILDGLQEQIEATRADLAEAQRKHEAALESLALANEAIVEAARVLGLPIEEG